MQVMKIPPKVQEFESLDSEPVQIVIPEREKDEKHKVDECVRLVIKEDARVGWKNGKRFSSVHFLPFRYT